MKIVKKILTFVFLTIIFQGKAQINVDTVRIEDAGKISIEMDPEIAKFINNKENTSCAVVRTTTKPTTTTTRPRNNPSDPCAGKTQMPGYKIQVYYSKNRAQADRVKREFEANFPSFSTEIVYMSPDYRVLVGDYFTKSSANTDIRKIKSKYNSAFAMQYRILCRRAK